LHLWCRNENERPFGAPVGPDYVEVQLKPPRTIPSGIVRTSAKETIAEIGTKIDLDEDLKRTLAYFKKHGKPNQAR
jgi:hypothetical protein